MKSDLAIIQLFHYSCKRHHAEYCRNNNKVVYQGHDQHSGLLTMRLAVCMVTQFVMF